MEFTHVANPVHVEARWIKEVHKVGTDGAGGVAYAVVTDDGTKVGLSPEQVARHIPQRGDYLVTQEDGYVYVNPRLVFDRKYRPRHFSQEREAIADAFVERDKSPEQVQIERLNAELEAAKSELAASHLFGRRSVEQDIRFTVYFSERAHGGQKVLENTERAVRYILDGVIPEAAAPKKS